MTLTGANKEEPGMIQAQAEAAAWIALLHSPERTRTIERALQAWIAADPKNAAAWEQATDLWNETAGLPRRIPRRAATDSRIRRLYRPALALAAVLSLVVAAVIFQYSSTYVVTTAVGEQRTLNLEDGSRVELNTNTRLRVEFNRQIRTVVLDSGEAYFQVAHERRPFAVLAGERKILALGTAFTVRRESSADDAVTVTLLEGRVAVTPTGTQNTTSSAPDTPVTVVNAGQRLRARPKAPPTLDSPSIDKATGWMRGQLIFDHTPLSEAAAEFSRYNKIKITVASPETAQIPIGGIFRIGDSASFARAVAATHDLKVIVNGNELVLVPTEAEAPSTSPNNAEP